MASWVPWTLRCVTAAISRWPGEMAGNGRACDAKAELAAAASSQYEPRSLDDAQRRMSRRMHAARQAAREVREVELAEVVCFSQMSTEGQARCRGIKEPRGVTLKL